LPRKIDLAKNWLPRYTGMAIDDFGDYVLLTNFSSYIEEFASSFGCDLKGDDRPMQAATNSAGLSMVNFGIGSPNAAIIMDLLTARRPKGVLFLGKCGGLKQTTDIGYFDPADRGESGARVRRTTTFRRLFRRCRRSS